MKEILFKLFIFCSFFVSNYGYSKIITENIIHPEVFGAIAGDNQDDYAAIQQALDSAALVGGTVQLGTGVYLTTNTLSVTAGVTLRGEGRGASATNTPSTGTIIKNIGIHTTIKVTGHNVVVENMVIYDSDNEGAAGGIALVGDGSIVESAVLRQVLIFGFTDGDALLLEAKNSGGVTYCSFYDVRIRHAKVGIKIKEQSGSFVNSNSFYHGAISGGGFDYCLKVEGGNSNIFNGIVMEPYTSNYGHLVVDAGQVIGITIRIEGAQQPSDIPLIEFKEGTFNSILAGTYSGGLTIDDGDNYIDLTSGKSIDFKNANNNLFKNAAFKNVTNNTIPLWEISGSGVTIESNAPEFLPEYNVVKINIPQGVSGYIRPAAAYLPKAMAPSKYDHVNFGAIVKASIPNLITATCKAPAGIVTSSYHPGDGDWHTVGMTSAVDKTTSYDPKFIFNNTSGAATTIYITTPALNFGYSPLEIESYLSTAGGVLYGTLTTGISSHSTQSSGFLVLPKNANVFEISGTNTIMRINHGTGDRFLKGTVITLIFNDASTSVINSGYIRLKAGFTSIQNSSLTLVAMGDGTWREISRNN